MLNTVVLIFHVCMLPLIDDVLCEQGMLFAEDCVVAERQMDRIVATMPGGREVFRGECRERDADSPVVRARETIDEANRGYPRWRR